MTHPPGYLVVIAIGISLLIANPIWVSAKQLYRWYDDEGNAHYSDQIPPQHSKFPRAKINSKGMAVQVFDGAKTKEQLDRQKRLEKLRAAQERLLNEQRDHDKALLRSFRSVQEIQATMAEKLSTVDVLINISESNIEKLRNQLEKQEKHAANLEKNGEKLPAKVVRNIEKSKNQILETQNKIADQKRVKNKIEEKYEKDIERFIKLTYPQQDAGLGLGTNPQPNSEDAELDSLAADTTVFLCADHSTCSTAWTGALAYVEKHATTDISIKNEKIIHTEDPKKDLDISLSVSRIPGNGKVYAKLFLDVRCKQTTLGQELCASEKVQTIRSGFKSFIFAKRP